MAKKKKDTEAPEEVVDRQEQPEEEKKQEGSGESGSEADDREGQEEENSLERELAEMKDKYLRLYSEFDNFRRRTAKERIELTGTATEDLMTALIPIIDDFERGIVNMEKAEDVNAVKEGVVLIFNKFKKILEAKGLRRMESSVGKEFDAEIHEAITQAPAPSEDLKGKIMDEIERGYYLNDKIIRYSKVVIGA